MTESIDFKTIHPDMKPVSDAPTQFSFFGTGTRLIGKRDYNNQSRSYVSTLCFTVLFVPIFPLSAYRVVQHGSSRYVVGKVPVSGFAKKAGAITVSGLLLTVAASGIYGYLHSAPYLARQQLSQADALVAAGNNAKAAVLYKAVFENSPDEFKDKAEESMLRLLGHDSIGSMQSAELAGTIKTIRSIPSWRLHLDNKQLLADAKSRLASIQQASPADAHQLYHSVADLAADDPEFLSQDEPLLRAILKQDPKAVDAIDELAQMMVGRGEQVAAIALLKSVEGKLGSREGARILGQAYVAEGNHQKAYPLLSAYMADRLKTLNEAEKHYFDLQKSLLQGEFDKLNKGQGDQGFYSRYENTPKSEQQALTEEYVANQLRDNKELAAALDAYRDKAKVVPVALDYGIVLLRRAEGMPDPAARNAELKHAESTFLAIHQVAGDSDEYRLYLGQVYYWLGKHAEGHKQFDDLLNKYKRSPESLLSVATILRNIGMDAEAASLAKESYDGSDDNPHRYAAAQTMALLVQTQKDRIFWLQRSDPQSPSVAVDLTTERGYAAERDGDSQEAAKDFRQAIERARVLPANSATYNNTALIYLALYRVSGDKSALDHGIELMEKAVELSPSDSILMSNVANYLTASALREIFADKIDFGLLESDPSLDYIDYLFADEHGYDEYRAKLANSALMSRATDYLKKSLLLAPKEARNYYTIYQLAVFTKDKPLLAYIDDKLTQNDVDLEAVKKLSDDYIHNVDQDEPNKGLRQQIALFRSIDQRKDVAPLNRAIAKSKLAELLLRQVQDGSLASADEAVQLLEAAQQLHPSSASSDLLVTALMTQASLATTKQSAGYLQLRRQAGRSLNDQSLAALTLYQNGPDAKLLQGQPSALRAFDLIERQVQLFPSSSRPFDWATVVHQKSAVAEKLARNIRASAESKLDDSIIRKLYGYSSYAAVGSFLYNKIGGEPLDSGKVLAEYERQHAYLPKELL